MQYLVSCILDICLLTTWKLSISSEKGADIYWDEVRNGVGNPFPNFHIVLSSRLFLCDRFL